MPTALHNVVGKIFHLDNWENCSEYAVMAHGELIRALGGGMAIARELASRAGGLSRRDLERLRDTIYKAGSNGVPWRYRPWMADIAREKGVELPRGFLDPAHSDPRESVRSRKAVGRKQKRKKDAA